MIQRYLKSDFKRIIVFFMISHGIPFLITAIIMFTENSIYITNPSFSKYIYAGQLSPTIAAVFTLYFFFDKKEKKEYWLSVIDFKRISFKWYFMILSLPIMLKLFASIIDARFNLHTIEFYMSDDMNLFYGLALLFFGPIPEELGWRGIALPELQKKFSLAFTVLFLGLMWGTWHLPLFFLKGTYQFQLGLFTPLFWIFMLEILFDSVIYGVIYNETKGSLLAAIIFHYLVNIIGEAFVITLRAEIISFILRGLLAIGLFIYCLKKYKLNKEYSG